MFSRRLADPLSLYVNSCDLSNLYCEVKYNIDMLSIRWVFSVRTIMYLLPYICHLNFSLCKITFSLFILYLHHNIREVIRRRKGHIELQEIGI